METHRQKVVGAKSLDHGMLNGSWVPPVAFTTSAPVPVILKASIELFFSMQWGTQNPSNKTIIFLS